MRSIRQQLTRKLLLGFVVLLSCGGLGVYFSTRAALLKEFNATLRAKANAITSGAEKRGTHIELEFNDQFMREFGRRIATDFYQMWHDGETLKRSESLAALDLPCRFGTLDKPKFWNLVLPNGARGRAIGFEFAVRDRQSSAQSEMILVVASDRRELDRTLGALALVLAGCGTLLLAATTLLVPRLLRRELVPVNELAEQAACINADSLAIRFSTDSMPDELRPISGRLNDLLTRLEQSFERERRFSADLAHELRTPIAELRSLAELALKWPKAREADTDREMLAIALQMEGIVNRLLALLRSEHGQLPVKREPVHLAPLVKGVCRTFAERASKKQLKLTLDVPEEAKIETDPVLVRSIVANLIDNAVEYTPIGGMIQVAGEMDAGRIKLRVSNTVENLTPEDMRKLFDRFWRKDLARSGSEHAGLGLPLARAFAHLVGGELTAALAEPSRLTLTFSSPAAVHE